MTYKQHLIERTLREFFGYSISSDYGNDITIPSTSISHSISGFPWEVQKVNNPTGCTELFTHPSRIQKLLNKNFVIHILMIKTVIDNKWWG